MPAATAQRRSKPSGAAKSRSAPRPPQDPATAYARAVVTGNVVAGRYVRLAGERHLRDLAEGKARGLVWRPDRAQHALDFFPAMLKLEDGSPFHLLPFQQFQIGSIFGWYKADGFRRFRTAYIEEGKGNGKSPRAAGVGIYMMVADGEPAPEVYSAATMKDQAKIVWKDAWRMVVASPELAELIEHPDNAEVQAGSLVIPGESAVFRPVSAEHKGLDGKRVHCALIDELHEHPGPMVVDKMTAGTKRRLNALIFEITNSGFDRTSVCYAHHELSVQVLERTVENDGWFAYVCTLDEGDDWRDPSVWPKANPGLGSILPESYLQTQVTNAMTMPSQENIVKRLNFCVWTEQSERWLTMEAWDACGKVPVREESFKGQRCFVGLDMASTADLCAAALLFPDGEGGFDLVMRFWMPQDALEVEGARKLERSEADRLMLRQWADLDLIKVTDGNRVDYDIVEADILQLAATFDLAELAHDRWNITQLISHLQDKLGAGRVVDHPQSMAGMSPPAKELERLLASGRLRHGSNPVLRWMAANVAVRYGTDEQIKPDREKSREKIDGIIALVMAIARASVAKPVAPEQDYRVDWV